MGRTGPMRIQRVLVGLAHQHPRIALEDIRRAIAVMGVGPRYARKFHSSQLLCFKNSLLTAFLISRILFATAAIALSHLLSVQLPKLSIHLSQSGRNPSYRLEQGLYLHA